MSENMSHIFVSIGGLKPQIFNTTETDTLSALFGSKLFEDEAYVIVNGKLSTWNTSLITGQTYHVIPRVLGGKGGFGSMLRALGAQIEKTTNREACRDISGRRMRDVNNEQKLRDWMAKASDREREKDQKRRERIERRRAEPRHVFDDPEYTKQKMQVTDELEEALQYGLQKASTSATSSSTTTSRKRKSEEPGPSSSKKAALEWLGVDNISDLDTDSDSDQDGSSDMVAGPRRLVVPDSGAVSGASSHTTECGDHSDSGVESVTDQRLKDASPMDVDSDSSAKDSAMTSDTEPAARLADISERMQMDQHAKMASLEPEAGTSGSQLLAAQSEQTPQAPAEVNVDEIDLTTYQSVSELEALGLDTLKAVLMSKGMKCGGTRSQRAERLWAARGLTNDQIDPSLRAKPTKGKKK